MQRVGSDGDRRAPNARRRAIKLGAASEREGHLNRVVRMKIGASVLNAGRRAEQPQISAPAAA